MQEVWQQNYETKEHKVTLVVVENIKEVRNATRAANGMGITYQV